jgi:hypothetical protein
MYTRTSPKCAARLLRLAGAVIPGRCAEQFRKYSRLQNLPRPFFDGSPTWARTRDLRINRPALSWDRISNQALATHAKFQEQQHTALNERHEGETSYEIATLLNVEKRVGQCVLSLSEDLEYGCAGLQPDPEAAHQSPSMSRIKYGSPSYTNLSNGELRLRRWLNKRSS